MPFSEAGRGAEGAAQALVSRRGVAQGRGVPAPPADRRMLGITFRLTNVTLFALMAGAIQLAYGQGASTGEIVFYRALFGLIPVLLWFGLTRNWGAWRTQRPGAHLTRGAIGLVSMLLSFLALGLLPLAEAVTLAFVAPLFSVLLSALWLREPVGRHRWSAVAAGFVGVALVAPPGGGLPLVGTVGALAGAFGVACVNTALREIGRTESTMTTVLWFSTLSTAVMALAMPFVAQPHDATTWAMLVAVGLFGGTAQLFFTASLRFAPIAVLAPLDYVQLLLAVLIGWLLWGTQPAPSTWIGAAVLIASVLYTLYRERHLGRLQARQGDVEPR